MRTRNPVAPGLCVVWLQFCVFAFLHFAVVASAQTPVQGQPTPQQPSSQEPPRFRAGVEVTPLDVTVVNDRGKPIAG
ncbi:MAG TPA: hypothetical protein VF219_13760, partial [Vicinamibacterales bacterium]